MPIPESKKLNDEWIQNNLADFLLACPYFFTRDYIPPFAIVNLRLKSGEWQPSMNPGVKWSPFEISKPKYDELVKQVRSCKPHLKHTDYPEQIQSEDDWTIYLSELLDGIPADEHKKIIQKVRAAEKARDDVMFYGKQGDLSKLSETAILANIEWSELTKRYQRN